MTTVIFGQGRDIPALADYGTGNTQFAAVSRAAGRQLSWNIQGTDGQVASQLFGRVGHQVLTNCDFNGDGSADLATLARRNGGVVLTYKSPVSGIEHQQMLPFRTVLKASCLTDTLDEIDSIVVHGKVRRENRYIPTLAVVRTSGEVPFSRVLPLSSVKALLSIDLNGDEIEELCVLRRRSGSGQQLQCFDLQSDQMIPLILDSVRGAEITAARLTASDGQVQDGILYIDRLNAVRFMNVFDLQQGSIAAISPLDGDFSIVPRVNFAKP